MFLLIVYDLVLFIIILIIYIYHIIYIFIIIIISIILYIVYHMYLCFLFYVFLFPVGWLLDSDTNVAETVILQPTGLFARCNILFPPWRSLVSETSKPAVGFFPGGQTQVFKSVWLYFHEFIFCYIFMHQWVNITHTFFVGVHECFSLSATDFY